MNTIAYLILGILAVFGIWNFFSKKENTKISIPKEVTPNLPDWHKNAIIYEVNLRL